MNSVSPNDKSSPLSRKLPQRMEPTNLVSTSTNTVTSEEDTKLNEMEERLNRNLMRNISKNLEGYINDSIKGALDNMTTAIEKLAETNQNLIDQNSEIKHLKDENIKLTSEVVHLQHKQEKINRKLKTIESNVISCSVIMRGIREGRYEKEIVLKDKVYTELAYLMESYNPQEQLEMAKQIGIKRC